MHVRSFSHENLGTAKFLSHFYEFSWFVYGKQTSARQVSS